MLKKMINLDEELRVETFNEQMNDTKSPVTVINEIMTSLKKKVVYDLVSETGEHHDRHFTYKLEIDGTCAYGNGSSKRDAKKKAALSFLDQFGYFIDNKATTPNRAPTELNPASDGSSPTELDLLTNKIDLKMKYEHNPIGHLQELCVANQWECPKYAFAETNSPTYKVVCTFSAYRSESSATDKKSAKKQAALLMVEQLIMDLQLDKTDGIKVENGEHNVTEKDHLTNKIDLKTTYEHNPIGHLQELCMAHHWECPKYAFVESNSLTYKVVCTFSAYRSEGSATDKKSAKKQAALLMVEQLIMDLQLDKTNGITVENGEHHSISSLAGMKPNNDTEKLSKRRSIISPCKRNIDTLFQQLKLSKKPSISELKNNYFMQKCKTSYKDFLKTIGEQEDFETTYTVELCQSCLGEEIIVRLSVDSMPVYTNVVPGNTIAEAEETAAKHALIFIKTKLDKM